MHAISEYVWAVVDPFEPPKKCKILDIILPTAYSNTTNTTYILRYESTDFEVYHLYVYSEQTQAEICWAMEFKSVFDHISKHPKIYDPTEYIKGNKLSTEILEKYARNLPHLLIKHI